MVISILGAGAWGTALAISLSNKHNVVLWTHNKVTFDSIKNKQESNKLPGCLIPNNVSVTLEIEETLNSELIILATPTQSIRAICQQLLNNNIKPDIPVIAVCKGIEQSTLMLPSEIIKEKLHNNSIVIFSGPSFAIEVANKLPYSMVLACYNTELGLKLMSKLQQKNLTLNFSNDIIGTQICAALKNVFAIACGIILGRNLGCNTHAILITKSMHEIRTLYKAKTGNDNIDTLLGPACLGDLVMTCTSLHSRNMSFGFKIGSSGNFQKSAAVVEGITTTKSLFNLAKKLQINLPICNAIYRLLYENATIDETILTMLK
ncbi:glycerol-3-phosphate dehydrogenase [Wolbachia pipientis]|uniref:Glycerol-3-phosphate dehydrogenase [NAD(P)+] n=1 Tax=Wolbachia pipientis TaxID=955 RepID=A0A1E7QKV4_WOLPI|nr:NAD(P)H-dependent glycerol-3-phosphate dehydrogenase [Wolbachia pipientis]OEY86976.1 glycerol-3-phosphate dehydrogenase [Wolbachia pipientis]